MNMMCFHTHNSKVSWAVQRNFPMPIAANRPIVKDKFANVGSFADTLPEDRDELLSLLEEAFARL